MTREDAASSEDGDHWEEMGRRLLRSELERVAYSEVQETFTAVAKRIGAGEEVTAADIEDLREAAEEAAQVAEMAAEVSPEAVPRPDVWNYLDHEERREYAAEVERRESQVNEVETENGE